MNLDLRLNDIFIACKIADWYSADVKIDYELDNLLGILFAEGEIEFFDGSILEFTESITPERTKYRYHYMNKSKQLIFRYDNVPHHREITTFPHHKHVSNAVVESQYVGLREVIEEIITILAEEDAE